MDRSTPPQAKANHVTLHGPFSQGGALRDTLGAADDHGSPSPPQTIRMLRHAHPAAQSHSALTGQHGITTYTPGLQLRGC